MECPKWVDQKSIPPSQRLFGVPACYHGGWGEGKRRGREPNFCPEQALIQGLSVTLLEGRQSFLVPPCFSIRAGCPLSHSAPLQRWRRTAIPPQDGTLAPHVQTPALFVYLFLVSCTCLGPPAVPFSPFLGGGFPY